MCLWLVYQIRRCQRRFGGKVGAEGLCEGRGSVLDLYFDHCLHDPLQQSVPIAILQAQFEVLTCFLLDLPVSGVQAVSHRVDVQSLAQRPHHTHPKA